MRASARIGLAGLALVVSIWTVRCGMTSSLPGPGSAAGQPPVILAMGELASAQELVETAGGLTPAVVARQTTYTSREGQAARGVSAPAASFGAGSASGTPGDREDPQRALGQEGLDSAPAAPSPTLMPPATALPAQMTPTATASVAVIAVPTGYSTAIPLPTPGPSATPKPSPTPTATPIPPTSTPTSVPAPTQIPAPTAIPPTPTPQAVSAAALAIDPAEYAVFAEVNRRRVELGLPELRPAASLFASAHAHSVDQAVAGFFGHTGSDGSDAGARMRAAGYNWANWGEAVGRSQGGDIGGIVDAFFNSPSHHEILFTTAFTEGGAGVAYAQNGAPYWTIDVANPRGG